MLPTSPETKQPAGGQVVLHPLGLRTAWPRTTGNSPCGELETHLAMGLPGVGLAWSERPLRTTRLRPSPASSSSSDCGGAGYPARKRDSPLFAVNLPPAGVPPACAGGYPGGGTLRRIMQLPAQRASQSRLQVSPEITLAGYPSFPLQARESLSASAVTRATPELLGDSLSAYARAQAKTALAL